MSADLRTQISAIAKRYHLFECTECATAIQAFLQQNKIPGQVITLFTFNSQKQSFEGQIMLDLYDLIRNIQKRPAIYLGQPSIDHLKTFLAGYFFARHQLGQPESLQEQHFTDFQSWIQRRFKIESSQLWDKIILFFSQDEQKALTQFFELFESRFKKDIKGNRPLNVRQPCAVGLHTNCSLHR